ncbi:ABC-type multidrug transport system ATPase subunit [Actinoplanes lutulentus]|uniref:ABC transporter family protein n=1 Tax=Actinoplanes lutulentus TaxID=1287878 RepID=A0A327ZIC8_9ACTN|nr:ATP-binding cassette domain-containing protein [Actinoplanes lutulentus]MBB2945364.1 ABC-type multidrug transport system ATPase subunit [Actinoplanes lutulentus]RAK40504.1 ABC transporter family protein [Actinoplanes lutulentus]
MLFEGLWFRYSRRAPWALRGAEATAAPGDTIVVLGPNGAGKSTLLQLAAGVLRPTRGRIRDRPSVVGWVPERFPAAQPFTALGYLHAMSAVRGLPARAADPWIERLGLAAHADTPLADLSKGTAQKVGLAQALLTPPGLLVLDEPWEGLDAASRTLIPEIVTEVTDAGGVVLVSDHRGEIANLPGARHWTLAAGELRTTTTQAKPETDELIVEVAVRRHEAAAAVVQLRAAGHRVLGVRENGLSVREKHTTVEEDR